MMYKMSNKYELLILDYGGVVGFDYDLASFEKITKEIFGKVPNGIEREKILEYASKLAVNEIDVEAYVARVANILRTTPIPVPEDFTKAHISYSFPPAESMVELIKEVRQQGIKVSLLSDMYEFEITETKPQGRYDGFDYVSFSSEVKLTKRDPKVFLATLEHFGTSADKALFVDDIMVHTEIAKSVGIDVLWADKSSYPTADLLANAIRQKLGLKIADLQS